MPRPNHPTDAEYDNALDAAAHYRLKCLKLEEERDTLLAALEHIEKVAAINAGPGLVDIRSTAYHAIRKAKGGE